MNKRKNANNKKNKNYNKSQNNLNPNNKKEQNKVNSEIPQYRMIIFTYYKNPSVLEIQKNNELNFKGKNNLHYNSNFKNYNSINQIGSNATVGNSNNNYENDNQTKSDAELYEKFGKYYTYYDSNNKIVYYNDKNLYNKRSNEVVHNFQDSDIGLANIGNSCYMNAFLQILLHTPHFLNYLHKYKIYEFEENTLVFNLGYLSQYPYNSKYLYNIKNIMKEINPQYGTFTPGDSQIFAIDFLDKLISECKGEESNDDSYESNYDNLKMSKIEKYSKFLKDFNIKKDEIEKLFQFSEVSIGRQSHNYTFSTNLHIELTFPQNNEKYITLYDLLNEKYINNNEIMKNQANMKRNKRTQIADIPEILILTFDRGVSGKRVIKTYISFSDNLDISPYIDPELKKYNGIKCTNYILYGINERYGQLKSQGHYISYIKIKNLYWHRFSDFYVIKSNPSFESQDVFGLYYVRKDFLD